jgi:hypothetical protein
MSGTLRSWQVGSTLGVVVLSVVSSLLGLSRSGHYAGASGIVARTRAEDAVILLVAVPVLAIGLRYAVRGSLRGRMVWLGALAYMAYVWLTRAGALAFNDFFLGYVVLFVLSSFTLVAGFVTTDAEAVHRGLEGSIPRRTYVGLLWLIAVGLSLLWLSDVVPATLFGTTPLAVQEFGPTGLITYVVDLGLAVPSFAVAGYWLRHGRSWGFVAAGVLLVFAGILAPGLTAITVVDLRSGVTMTPGLVVGTVLPPAVAGAFALWYLLAMPGRGRPDATDGTSAT